MHEIAELIEENARRRSLRRIAEGFSAETRARVSALVERATDPALSDGDRAAALDAVIREIKAGAGVGLPFPDEPAFEMSPAELRRAVLEFCDAAAIGEIARRLWLIPREGRRHA